MLVQETCTRRRTRQDQKYEDDWQKEVEKGTKRVKAGGGRRDKDVKAGAGLVQAALVLTCSGAAYAGYLVPRPGREQRQGAAAPV